MNKTQDKALIKIIDILGKVPIFKGIKKENLDLLASMCRLKSYEKKSILFLEGEQCDYLHIVAVGKVRAFKSLSNGKEFFVRLFNPADLFGEACLFDDNEGYPVSTQTVDETHVILIHKKDLKAIMMKEPEIAIKLLTIFSKKLIYLMKQIHRISFRDNKGKVASYLLELYEENNDKDQVLLNLSRSDIAARLGTVRENVSRCLSSFEQEGIIQIEGKKLKFLNIDRLYQMVED